MLPRGVRPRLDHAHGDLTSLAPHERLPEILVVPKSSLLLLLLLSRFSCVRLCVTP